MVSKKELIFLPFILIVVSVFWYFVISNFVLNIFNMINNRDDGAFIIISPYANVNWDTFGQYKAAHHVHTTNSDGQSSTARVAELHYELGFHIVAFTDHNFTTTSPDAAVGGLAMFGPYEPMTLERIVEMEAGVGRNDGKGMIFIPYSNERSSLELEELTQRPTGHHLNTFWSNIDDRREPIHSTLERIAEEGNGMAIINHPGRYTGAHFPTDFNEATTISNNPANYLPYANLFKNYPQLIGMEIINKFDTESQADRILWDNILSAVMPYNIPVWGFANDDSHFDHAIGFAYNLMLMPELSLSNVKYSMQNGAFLAFSRVDRQYGIYPGYIKYYYWYGNEGVRDVLNLPKPVVNRISTNQSSITIDADTYTFINWYADGNLIHQGSTLYLMDHYDHINSYVRATIGHEEYGVIYTQPFKIMRQSNQ